MAYENGIRDILKEITAEYGIQVLYNGRKVNALLKDLALSYERERKMIKAAYDENIHIRLLNSMEQTEDEKRAVLEKCIRDLVEEAWLAKEGAGYAVYSFAYVLGWDALMQEEGRQNAVPADVSSNGSLDGVLKKGKHMLDNLDFTSGLLGYKIIGYKAFASNLHLQDITVPQNISVVGKKAFFGCVNLRRALLPKSVTAIGELAFEGCYDLKAIAVEEGNPAYQVVNHALIQKEGRHLLRYAGEGSTFQIPEGVLSVAEKAFDKALVQRVQIPRSVTKITFRSFYICEELSEFTADRANTAFTDVGGVLHSKDRKVLLLYPCGRKDVWYVVEDFVAEIGEGAFLRAEHLQNITIPGSVKKIGDRAFAYCIMLSSAVLPSGLSVIGNSSFYHCIRLSSVLLPKGIKEIGDKAFAGCALLTSISFPPSVVRIGSAAFQNCYNLKRILIHEGVSFIGEGAFEGCPYDVEVHVKKGSYAESWFQLRNFQIKMI